MLFFWWTVLSAVFLSMNFVYMEDDLKPLGVWVFGILWLVFGGYRFLNDLYWKLRLRKYRKQELERDRRYEAEYISGLEHCARCDQMISTEARVCPHCGHPYDRG